MTHAPRLSNRHHHLLLALACALLLLGILTGTAHAESWGEVSHAGLTTGSGAGAVAFKGSSSTLAFAANPDDRSYYIGDEPKAGEYRIQRFVTTEVGGVTKAEVEGSISFSPPDARESHGGEGTNGVGLELAVDPARNRVYALVVYQRREVNAAEEKGEEKEEKELANEGKTCERPKTCYEHLPLDSEELAASELYAFEYASGKLVSVKEEGAGKPAALIKETTAASSTTAFADQSEDPKEALLNPRGMAIDPATGNLVIVGDEDEEPDENVEKEEAEKQCRAVGQFILLEEKSGKLAKGKLGHRYVDKADALRPDEPGCEPEEHKDAPLSPAVTSAGNLLVYSGAQAEGQVWEFPTPGSSSGEGEVATQPRKLFEEAKLGGLLGGEPPEEGAGPTMSFVPEGASEGTIYLATEADEVGAGYDPVPLVLRYAEAGGAGQVSETGWTAGSTTDQCGIPRLAYGEKVLLAGLAETKTGEKGGVLVLAPWVEQGGAGTAHLEAFEFGPGGSTTGCPTPSLSTPHVIYGENQNADEVVAGEPVSISSDLTEANAKSVEWKFKYTNPETGESGEETAKQEGAEFQAPSGYEFKPLEYSFKHTGSYEITEVARTDDLAQEEVRASEVLKVTVSASPLRIKFAPPAAVSAGEGEAEISATVTDSEATELKFKRVVWNFGDGTEAEQTVAPVQSDSTELHIKHTFVSRCGRGKCKITLTVEGAAAEGKPAVAHVEITVNESQAEAKAKVEAEAKAKAEAEAKAKAEAEAKAQAEAAQHKAEEEAARAKAEAEAKAKAEAEARAKAEAEAKKHKEEEEAKSRASSKPPTRAQLLTKALTVCKKQPKKKRAKCEATAHKKYGPKPKPKKKHKK